MRVCMAFLHLIILKNEVDYMINSQESISDDTLVK